jgi:hypothetical protein
MASGSWNPFRSNPIFPEKNTRCNLRAPTGDAHVYKPALLLFRLGDRPDGTAIHMIFADLPVFALSLSNLFLSLVLGRHFHTGSAYLRYTIILSESSSLLRYTAM